MTGLLRRFGYSLSLIVLTVVIFGAGAFIVIVVLPDLQDGNGLAPSPTPGASASTAPFMTWVSMPADANCSACHVTDQGLIGLATVPAMAHPLDGWTDCTSCHDNDRLVATAPGHAGIHASDCLLCHQPAQLPPPLSRPHRDRQNQDCLDCHGVSAPLPTDMAHRSESVCWLCHRLPDSQPPVPPHQVSAGETDCLNCHVAGVLGALPDDHATRSASECLLCHGLPPSPVPAQGGTSTVLIPLGRLSSPRP